MDLMLLLMRLLHILLGVFWAGTLLFNALYLQPAMRDAGPDAAKVAAGLMQRRFLDVMPVVALLTILSGLWLYWWASNGFDRAYMESRMGTAIGIGAVAALVAFGIGVGVLRPSMLRAAALAQSAAQASPAEREAAMATAQALRMRAAKAGRLVAVLLTITVVTMAVARYL